MKLPNFFKRVLIYACVLSVLAIAYNIYTSIKKTDLVKELQMTSEEALAQTYKTVGDETPQITWYYHPTAELYVNPNQMTIYLGKRMDEVWMQLTMSYTADEWLNYTNVYIEVDGKVVEIPYDNKRDKLYDKDIRSELIELKVWPEMRELLMDCVTAKSVNMIFKGEEIKEIPVGKDYLEPLGQMILAYYALKDEG